MRRQSMDEYAKEKQQVIQQIMLERQVFAEHFVPRKVELSPQSIKFPLHQLRGGRGMSPPNDGSKCVFYNRVRPRKIDEEEDVYDDFRKDRLIKQFQRQRKQGQDDVQQSPQDKQQRPTYDQKLRQVLNKKQKQEIEKYKKTVGKLFEKESQKLAKNNIHIQQLLASHESAAVKDSQANGQPDDMLIVSTASQAVDDDTIVEQDDYRALVYNAPHELMLVVVADDPEVAPKLNGAVPEIREDNILYVAPGHKVGQLVTALYEKYPSAIVLAPQGIHGQTSASKIAIIQTDLHIAAVAGAIQVASAGLKRRTKVLISGPDCDAVGNGVASLLGDAVDIYLVDRHGLVTTDRADHVRERVLARADISVWKNRSLDAVYTNIHPDVLVGTGGAPGTFTREMLHNIRGVICCGDTTTEAKAQDVYNVSAGTALYCAASEQQTVRLQNGCVQPSSLLNGRILAQILLTAIRKTKCRCVADDLVLYAARVLVTEQRRMSSSDAVLDKIISTLVKKIVADNLNQVMAE